MDVSAALCVCFKKYVCQCARASVWCRLAHLCGILMGESVLLAGVCLCVLPMSVFVSAFHNAFVFLSYIRVCYVLIYLHHMCLCVICVCANVCTHTYAQMEGVIWLSNHRPSGAG